MTDSYRKSFGTLSHFLLAKSQCQWLCKVISVFMLLVSIAFYWIKKSPLSLVSKSRVSRVYPSLVGEWIRQLLMLNSIYSASLLVMCVHIKFQTNILLARFIAIFRVCRLFCDLLAKNQYRHIIDETLLFLSVLMCADQTLYILC